ncbi:MAG: DUF370 domain-containing protein [Ruminococcaceae bacterium]|nr:DUF370 domain-containing protein [Oscillospiraceae bacterium]
MYLHLGQDVVVNTGDVIAILDMDNTTVSKITKEFLKGSEEEGFVVNVSEDLPKSYVLCERMGKPCVYISPISSSTLLKRAEQSRI